MRILNKDFFEIFRKPQPLVLPELVSLGRCVTNQPHQGGVRTDGQDGLEIGYIDSGSIEWWTGGGLEEAGAGSFIIDWPGDWQGGTDAIIHPCRRYWVRFNFPPRGELPGISDATLASLKAVFETMTVRHFPAVSPVKELFEQLLHQQRSPGWFGEEISRAVFHQILFATANASRLNRQVRRSRAVVSAIEYMRDHLHEECRVEDVAAHVGLSVGYFHEIFWREVRITPSQFHLRSRVALAKRELIYTDAAITGIAMKLGYSSSQYFATVFKKVVGMTPKEYRGLHERPLADPPAGQLSGPSATARTATRAALWRAERNERSGRIRCA